MKEIKRLTITFDSDGLWRIDKNYEETTNAENQSLKDCVASLCEDLEMNEDDFYFL